MTVTTDSNDGVCDADCSFREALLASGPGHTVNFNLPGVGVQTLTLDSPIVFSTIGLAPAAGVVGDPLVDTLLINGFSQPGSTANTNPTDVASNAVRNILVKALTPGTDSALWLTSDWITTVKGLAFQGFENFVRLDNAATTTVDGVEAEFARLTGTTKGNLTLLNSEFNGVVVDVTANADSGKNITLSLTGNVGENTKFELDSEGKGSVDVVLLDDVFTLGTDYFGTTIDLKLKTDGAVIVNDININNSDFVTAGTEVGLDVTAGSTLLGEPITLDLNVSGSTIVGMNTGIQATATANVVGTWAQSGNVVTDSGFGASWFLDGNVGFTSDGNRFSDNSEGGISIDYNTFVGQNVTVTLSGDVGVKNGFYNGQYNATGLGTVDWNMTNMTWNEGGRDGGVWTASANAHYDVTINDSEVQNNVRFGLDFGRTGPDSDLKFNVDVNGTDIGGNDQAVNTTLGFSLGFSDTPNTVHNNRLGLVLDGTIATIDGDVFTDNEVAIWVKNSEDVTIAENTITNNSGTGILIDNSAATIKDNGDISGNGDGIVIQNGGNGTVSGNTITGNTGTGIRVEGTGTVAITGNVASGNGGSGITVQSPQNATISGNTVFDNTGLDVDVGGTGRDANDPGDSDLIQNYPVIATAELDTDGNLQVEYKVDSIPGNSVYPLTVNFFADGVEDRASLGSATFTEEDFSGGSGSFNLTGAVSRGIASGTAITATATAGDGNISEMSDAIQVTEVAPKVEEPTPTPTPIPTQAPTTPVSQTPTPAVAPTAAPTATTAPAATGVPAATDTPNPTATTAATATSVPTAQAQPTAVPEAQPTSAPSNSSGGSCSLPSRDGGKIQLSSVTLLIGVMGLVVAGRRSRPGGK